MILQQAPDNRTHATVTSRRTSADEQPTAARRWHRVSRTSERDPRRAAAAVPAGCVRARTREQWRSHALRLVEAQTSWCEAKKDRMRHYIDENLAHLDGASMTTIMTNEQAMKATDASRSTVKNYRRWMEAHGLIAEVAGGRRGRFAPLSTNALRRAGRILRGQDGQPIMSNDAAVRVLTLRVEDARDEELTPGPRKGFKSSLYKYTPTREEKSRGDFHKFNPIHGCQTEAERLTALWPTADVPAHRKRSWWSPNATRGKDKERAVAAARLLAEEVPAFRATTDTWIGWVIRPFIRAGWSVADIRWAVDHKPSGQPWTHEARVRHVAQWLRYRLVHWLNDEGAPLPSRRQINDAEHARVLARHAAEVAARRSAPVMAEADRFAAMIRTQRVLLGLARTSGERARITAHIDELEAARDALSAQDGTNPKKTR